MSWYWLIPVGVLVVLYQMAKSSPIEDEHGEDYES